VWIYDLRRHEGRRLPVDGRATWPVWSPDGEKMAVWLTARRDPGIYILPALTAGPAERIFDEALPCTWSPDGHWLAFNAGQGRVKQGVVGVGGGRSVIPLSTGMQFSFSSDSRHLAYVAEDTGTNEIWVSSLDGSVSPRQVSAGGGVEPLWVRDQIFYRNGRRWFAARVTSLDPQVQWEPPRQVFEADFLDTPGISYAVSPDGQRLFVVRSAREPVVSKLAFVQNWFEELKAKVPVSRGGR
jgi:dipeptidyl aminopeptidase/acylaminoacyl peptidase